MTPAATHAKLKDLLSEHPSLSDDERHDVAGQLQATLVDLVDLSLIGKQYHWNITGPHFRPLHLMLDELVEAWRLQADTIAERMSAIGVCPDGRASTVASDSEIANTPDGPIKDKDVIAKLTDQLATAIEKVNERIERIGDTDPSSQDALIDLARLLEENHWMLAVQLA